MSPSHFCTACGMPIGSSAKFCSHCGAPKSDELVANMLVQQVETLAPRCASNAASLPSSRWASANAWLIITVVVLELVGDNAADRYGVTAFSVVSWAVATLIGIYLITTRNAINKIVGGTKVCMFAVWLVGLAVTATSNHLSGTYSDAMGLATMTFTPSGQFSYNVAGGNPMTGTYQVSGNTLTLSPPGATGSAPDSKSDPMGSAVYHIFQSELTAGISPDRKTIDYAGQELTKR